MADPAEEAAEQDVLVVLPMSNRLMGTAAERREFEALGDELEQVVTAAGVGEYDGEEYGGGECTLFFAGPDAERLAGALLPVLRRTPRARGGRLLRQAGADGADRVEIGL